MRCIYVYRKRVKIVSGSSFKFKGLPPWCADPFSVFGNKSLEAEATHAAMGKAKVSAGPKIQSTEGSRLFEAEAKRAGVTRKLKRRLAKMGGSRRYVISLSNFSF